MYSELEKSYRQTQAQFRAPGAACADCTAFLRITLKHTETPEMMMTRRKRREWLFFAEQHR